MDTLKRKLVFNESLDKSTKKYLNQSISSIEHLSNEIFYEIFDYFDGSELVKTFSNLNTRFEQFLHSSSFLIKTHFYLFYYEKMINTDYELEIFSTKLWSNLKILFIHCSKNIIFLDAHRWEKLILHCYPQLEKFYFTYYDRMNNNNQYEIYSRQINQFSSLFWIERKWIFFIKIDNTDIKYMIYPYKKTWYDDFQDENIVYSTATTLILTNSLTFSYDEILFEKINRVLTITQIYHLIIIDKHSSIHVLIDLINSLPKLITFKLRSISSDDRTSYTGKEFYTVCSMNVRSKITKVYIEELNNIDDFYCITMLCPRIKYFKVKYLNNINIKLLLRTILENLNKICLHYMRSLYFHVPAANDQMIENLQQMIKYEQPFLQFSIKRIVDDICLQWK
ncbi:unnamed protein product [Rotaria sordida]|uniref:F-box domain-containing protein n=1 Tax=Rotaria sordida TaxID=392033 RepID=A0A819IJR5_9BILA|nr:unnamed protein product [Rotaria sordida]CAF3914320.1 unnamed protein product [Rotaria sordida]